MKLSTAGKCRYASISRLPSLLYDMSSSSKNACISSSPWPSSATLQCDTFSTSSTAMAWEIFPSSSTRSSSLYDASSCSRLLKRYSESSSANLLFAIDRLRRLCDGELSTSIADSWLFSTYSSSRSSVMRIDTSRLSSRSSSTSVLAKVVCCRSKAVNLFEDRSSSSRSSESWKICGSRLLSSLPLRSISRSSSSAKSIAPGPMEITFRLPRCLNVLSSMRDTGLWWMWSFSSISNPRRDEPSSRCTLFSSRSSFSNDDIPSRKLLASIVPSGLSERCNSCSFHSPAKLFTSGPCRWLLERLSFSRLPLRANVLAGTVCRWLRSRSSSFSDSSRSKLCGVELVQLLGLAEHGVRKLAELVVGDVEQLQAGQIEHGREANPVKIPPSIDDRLLSSKSNVSRRLRPSKVPGTIFSITFPSSWSARKLLVCLNRCRSSARISLCCKAKSSRLRKLASTAGCSSSRELLFSFSISRSNSVSVTSGLNASGSIEDQLPEPGQPGERVPRQAGEIVVVQVQLSQLPQLLEQPIRQLLRVVTVEVELGQLAQPGEHLTRKLCDLVPGQSQRFQVVQPPEGVLRDRHDPIAAEVEPQQLRRPHEPVVVQCGQMVLLQLQIFQLARIVERLALELLHVAVLHLERDHIFVVGEQRLGDGGQRRVRYFHLDKRAATAGADDRLRHLFRGVQVDVPQLALAATQVAAERGLPWECVGSARWQQHQQQQQQGRRCEDTATNSCGDARLDGTVKVTRCPEATRDENWLTMRDIFRHPRLGDRIQPKVFEARHLEFSSR
uniref:Uncharacterized protein n=1 Tax=Anopheles atroparvus TaxID=41427 RepID=A0A182JDB7_ANOAO